jgi:mRNA interferase YafQ
VSERQVQRLFAAYEAHEPAGLVSKKRDRSLPPANRDHDLTGEWKDHRECHLRPALLLICRKPDADRLQLVRLGSHSELFG